MNPEEIVKLAENAEANDDNNLAIVLFSFVETRYCNEIVESSFIHMCQEFSKQMREKLIKKNEIGNYILN